MTGIAATSIAPSLYRKLLELHGDAESQAVAAGVEKPLLELVRIRASQLNACAFCVDLHSTAAVSAGESVRRLNALPVWRTAGMFSDREVAALGLAEAITVAGGEVGDGVLAAARLVFDEAELGHLVWAVTVVNAFNRLGVAGGMKPA